MRLSVVVIVACLVPARCLHFGNGTDIEDFYVRVLDRVIRVLDDLVQRTDRPSEVDKERVLCLYGLNALLKNLGTSWAIAMIDSASKLQSGILNGNLMDLGNYDQCVQASVDPTPEQPNLPSFTGQHCLVTHQIFLPNGTIQLKGETQRLRDLFGYDFVPLTLAQCYPSLCRPWVMEEALNSLLSLPDEALTLFGMQYSLNVTIDPMDCHVAEPPPIDATDWVFLGVILLLVFLGLVSSAVDFFYINSASNKRPSSQTMKLLGSFSLYSNATKLFSTRMSADAIHCLNGLKFFSMCWVILGHRYMYLSREPISNFADLPDDLKRLFMMTILNGPLAVDTFFLISGMLNMYGFCSVMEKKKRYTIRDVIGGYIHRYLRLTPAYLIMIGFTATWAYRLRDGPLWDRFAGDYKDLCRQYYWANIAYINNYYFVDDGYCMMQSWYLAADMQMFWLSPLLIYPLWRWPKVGLVEWFLLVIASILSPFLVSWFGHIQSPVPITSDPVRRQHDMALLYFPAHTKSVSYVIGIGFGYFLYKYRKGSLRINLNIWIRAVGWIASSVLMLYAIFGGYDIYQIGGTYHQLFSAFFIGFQRFFWSSGLTWLIWMCITGNGGMINSFLSWKVFIPLGRLCYSVYLTHIVILTSSVGALRNVIYYNDYDQIEMFLGDVLMCMFSGLLLTLLVESPALNIEKLLLGGGGRRKPSRSQDGLRPSAPPSEATHLHTA